MLKLAMHPVDEKASRIVKKFVNDRLISLMEGIILDEVDFNLAMSGQLAEEDINRKFDEMVDISELMTDLEFAENVPMVYLPDNYPIEKANHEFFGLYRLLKAKKEYVPELPMEYILYHIIQNEIWQIDQINEDSEDGLFDMLIGEEGFEGIEDEEYSTILPIPEPDRSAVLAALEVEADGEEYSAEDLIRHYEDLRDYEDVCFWDTDFDFLNYMDEDSLIHSEMGEFMGLPERQDSNIIAFPAGKDGTDIKAEIKIAPWELEDE